MSAQPQSDDLVYIPRTSIRVIPEFNPRKNFSERDIAAFAERIRRSNWLSPLLVRPDPNGDGYILVAGERRLRAVTLLEWDEVPVTIKQMTDHEHHQLAMVENVDRKELGVAEEILSARDYVDSYGGDHEQAAESLGWPVQKLRHRLRLLHATQDVLKALLDEKIQLGHAELLAALPEQNQAKALPRILEQGLSVSQLRDQLKAFATPLEKAIFDLAGCSNCPYNSEQQQSLFASNIGTGLCTNRSCYQDKTTEALSQKRDALREDFGTVVLLSEKVPGTTIPLVKFGESGVGEQQYDACRACDFRGAAINDSPGGSCGNVESPLCFNLTCHRTKVAEYAESLAPADAEEGDGGDADGEANDSAPGESKAKPGSSPGGKAAASSKSEGKGKASKSKPQARATLKAVVNQYAGIVRRAALTAVQQDARLPLAYAAFALLRSLADEMPRTTFTDVCKQFDVPCRSNEDSFKRQCTEIVLSLAQRSVEDLNELIQKATVILLESHPDDTSFNSKLNRRALAAHIVDRTGTELLPFVVIDEAYLGAHTRSAMEGVLEESGFKEFVESQADGKKRYAAILGEKKDDAVKSVLAYGHDFTGYLPSGLKPEMKDWLAFKKS